MVTILDHFNRKLIRLNSSTLAPYAKRKIVSVRLFFKQTSRPFDDYNNQHSHQQGAGEFDNEYVQIVCCIGCSDKSV